MVRRRSVEQLLGDLKWIGRLQIEYQAAALEELRAIRERIENMPSEVVNKVNAKFDAIEQTLRDEADEIKAAIEAAGAGGATPEEVAALEARADAINNAVEALAAAPAPPADPPSE